MSKAVWQNGLYALIIVLVILICVGLSPSPAFTPHGIYLPTEKPGAPVPAEQVRLYSSFPENYKVVGQIRTALHVTSTLNQASINSDAKSSYLYARGLAANAGANGIVINTIGTTGEAGPLNALVLYATAISVTK